MEGDVPKMEKKTLYLTSVLTIIIVAVFIIWINYGTIFGSQEPEDYTITFVLASGYGFDVDVQIQIDDEIVLSDTIENPAISSGLSPTILRNVTLEEGEHIIVVTYYDYSSDNNQNQTSIILDHDIYITTYPTVNEVQFIVSDEAPEFG